MRGATLVRTREPILHLYFYSRTSCEVRLGYRKTVKKDRQDFYSRTSCEVRRGEIMHCQAAKHFYSRTSCEVRLDVHSYLLYTQISTHAPLARCDVKMQVGMVAYRDISTHAPLARCDGRSATLQMRPKLFLLTHLLRGATMVFILSKIILF